MAHPGHAERQNVICEKRWKTSGKPRAPRRPDPRLNPAVLEVPSPERSVGLWRKRAGERGPDGGGDHIDPFHRTLLKLTRWAGAIGPAAIQDALTYSAFRRQTWAFLWQAAFRAPLLQRCHRRLRRPIPPRSARRSARYQGSRPTGDARGQRRGLPSREARHGRRSRRCGPHRGRRVCPSPRWWKAGGR